MLYLDVNNLYGKAMMDVLPKGNYKLCNFTDEAKFLQHLYDNQMIVYPVISVAESRARKGFCQRMKILAEDYFPD